MKKFLSLLLCAVLMSSVFCAGAINIDGAEFDDLFYENSTAYESYNIPSGFSQEYKDILIPNVSNLISSFPKEEEAFVLFNQINLFGNLTDALKDESFFDYLNNTKDKADNFYCFSFVNNEISNTYKFTVASGECSAAEKMDVDFMLMSYGDYYIFTGNLGKTLNEYNLNSPEKARFLNIPYLGVQALLVRIDGLEYFYVMDIRNSGMNKTIQRGLLYLADDFVKAVSAYYYNYSVPTSENRNSVFNESSDLAAVFSEASEANLTQAEKDRYFLDYTPKSFKKHYVTNSSSGSNQSVLKKPAVTAEKTATAEKSGENILGNTLFFICAGMTVLYAGFLLVKKLMKK